MATESSKTRPEPKKTKQTLQSPLPAEDSHLLPNLPFEIIVEILLRLSVKSLLRFRCVTKLWRSLISQTEFAKTHLRLASVNTDYTHHRLILQGLCSYDDFKSCSLYSVLNEKSDTAVEVDCPLKITYSPVMVVGSCDGLVCIAVDLKVFIWNPSTRKSKRLPNAETLYSNDFFSINPPNPERTISKAESGTFLVCKPILAKPTRDVRWSPPPSSAIKFKCN
ncbi:hypothetical protein RHSIM_Rhsim02G0055100 [Rhododendron simsii]|uniref:F-box domain-containing protein n=1 Tax=Rhododendron simsii TaxID=118357 RepID=A0A834LTZ9_RHOSS|nr:hypothetical protein RHSIM_Rhsim02G0055100 [Rhododendron simsii]